ncbi:MAG: hypothetical protein R3E04_12565 [Sphingobium sp.]
MPRIDAVSADRAIAVRPVQPVAAVQAAAASGQSAAGGNANADGGEQARREHMASASDYARVHARIADILADVDAAKDHSAAALQINVDRLEVQRQPMIIIPMPPASVEQIERAVALAQDMAKNVALTRAAQANVPVGAVDQLMALSA